MSAVDQANIQLVLIFMGMLLVIMGALAVRARREAVHRTNAWFDQVDGGLAAAQRMSLDEFRDQHGYPRTVTFWRGKTQGWMADY